MKKRSTTPISKSFVARGSLLTLAILMAVSAPIAFLGSQTSARDYDAEIRAAQQQIDQYNAEAGRLASEADTLQNKVTQLNNEKAAIQAEIDLSQARYDKLVADIKANEIEIARKQQALGTTIADVYVDADISPLEMLASSSNIADYVDKQSQRSSIRDSLYRIITEIKQLKKELEAQQTEVEQLLAEQTNQRNELAAKQAEQQRLLDDTRGQESAYLEQLASAKSRMAAIHAEQQAALARITQNGAYNAGSVGSFEFRNFSGNQGCSGGYPYCGGKDTMVDPWDLYNQECVSYSAWRAVQMGKRVGRFSGRGNAYEWPSTTSGWMGATVNNTPAVGAVAILPSTPGFAPIGHSMNVEAILGDGWVRISQFNFGGTGEFSTMDIKASGVVFVHFPN